MLKSSSCKGKKLESYADHRQDVDAQKAVQAEGSTPESSTSKRQDADTQSQHNADNTTKPRVVTNPTVTGNNNNENSFLSELSINENQSFVSEQLRADDTVANIKKQARGTITIVKSLFQINLKILTWRQKLYKLRRKES